MNSKEVKIQITNSKNLEEVTQLQAAIIAAMGKEGITPQQKSTLGKLEDLCIEKIDALSKEAAPPRKGQEKRDAKKPAGKKLTFPNIKINDIVVIQEETWKTTFKAVAISTVELVLQDISTTPGTHIIIPAKEFAGNKATNKKAAWTGELLAINPPAEETPAPTEEKTPEENAPAATEEIKPEEKTPEVEKKKVKKGKAKK